MILPKWPDPRKLHHLNLGLERINQLLQRLNNPHLNIPKTIHVAGTNGKGSTLAFLKHIFMAANYKVHRYTSPHLVEFNERIEIANNIITDELLESLLNECQKACEKKPTIDITYFEAITACAFLAFSQIKADILLLETGMGGQYDATNVLPKVMQSIITPISYDHQEYLGNNLSEIAQAKAGIIKANCKIICSNQEKNALEVIKRHANEKNAHLVLVDEYFKQSNFPIQQIKIPLQGNHQIQNAKTAICAIVSQNDFKINFNHIKNGVETTKWPARLEKISTGTLAKKLPENYKIYVDGSHNIEGAYTVKEFLSNFFNHHIILIFQMMKDKDALNFIKVIADNVKEVYIKQSSDSRYSDPQSLKKMWDSFASKTLIYENFSDIFDEINKNSKQQNTLILICGSLYLAGDFLNQNNLTQIRH